MRRNPVLERMTFHRTLRTLVAQLAGGPPVVAMGRCAYCGPTCFVRPPGARGASDIRCASCSAGAVQLSIGWALRDFAGPLGHRDVCEFSANGPLARYLLRTARSIATSEYFPDTPPGTLRGGVRCEDMCALGYADASFDLVTHTEVLEHVADDAQALSEILRVLRPGGMTIFTVPLHDGLHTVQRARLRDGVVEHLLEPVYHTDPLRTQGILAFRDYGLDILDRLHAAGFVDARIVVPSLRGRSMRGLPVIFAHKAA